MATLITLPAMLLSSLAAIHAADVPQPATASKPNIIFILADDLSYWDLSWFGQTHFATPNIDRLASQGRVFANAYAGGPWCAPSRTALLTGMNAWHFAPLAKDAHGRATKFNPTVAEMLKAAGYATCALGKWHMAEGPASWLTQKAWAEQKAATNWRQMPWHRGFDVCRIGYRCGFLGGNGNPYWPFQIETGDNQEIRLPQNLDLDSQYLWRYQAAPAVAATLFDAQGRFVDKRGKNSSQMRYSEDIYREEAVAFMRANKERPFYLHYATPLVHGPLGVKELGEFKDKPAAWTYPHRLWAAMVQELDRSVGILMDEIRKLGLEKNTIVLFASDNGYSEWGYFGRAPWTDDPLFHNKGPWNRGKFITTNGGVIVPFLAWGPGRVPPGKTERAVTFCDFMATARDLAGAKLPGPTDGVSFAPLLEGRDKDQPLRSSMVWPQKSASYTKGIPDDWDTKAKPARQQRLRIPDAVLLDEKWYVMALGETIRVFNITVDPGMRHDLSAAHPELCSRAIAVLRDLDTNRKKTR